MARSRNRSGGGGRKAAGGGRQAKSRKSAAAPVAEVEVVEEEAAHAPRLVAVGEVEVAVAPLLEARVVLFAVGVAGRLGRAVPVHRVLLVTVEGRQVVAAAEPAHGRLVRRAPRTVEPAEVGVRRGHVGIARVGDERDRERREAAAHELGLALGRGGGEALPTRVAEVHGALLEHGSVRDHARTRQSAARSFEAILVETGLPVLLLERAADAILQPHQKVPHGGGFGGEFHGAHASAARLSAGGRTASSLAKIRPRGSSPGASRRAASACAAHGSGTRRTSRARFRP